MKKKQNGELSYFPTDLTKFFESEFGSWMDRYFELYGTKGTLGEVFKNPPDQLLDLLREKGCEHEDNLMKDIEEQYEVVSITDDKDISASEKIRDTINAMKKGAPMIYQAALQGPVFFGYADLLRKVKGESKFGDYHYEPVDIKIAKTPKPTAILQLCAYAEALQQIQGTLPQQMAVITKSGEPHEFQVERFYYFYLKLKKRFQEFHKEFDETTPPLPGKSEEHYDWSSYAKKILHENDDIQITAGIRRTYVDVLRERGITTMTQLSELKPDFAKDKISEESLKNLIEQARLQCLSRVNGKTEFEVLQHEPGLRQGLSILPEPHPQDIFFDMEGYPLLGENGLEYLYGAVDRGEGKTFFHEYWAKAIDQEAKAFSDFIEFAHERWSENPGMHIYHYGHYEQSTIKRLMGRYGLHERKIDDLLRNQVFVDLYQVVIQGLRVGGHSYSLKVVETLYYPARLTDVGSGAESAIEFSNYLETDNEEFLDKIREYNKDDCWSTKDLEQFLRKIKDENGIEFVPFSDEQKEVQEPDPESIKEQCSQLAKELLATIPENKLGLPLEETTPMLYLRELFAYLLDFHRREDNPEWWTYFQRLELSYDQLFYDSSVATGVKIIERDENNHLVCEFDPIQQTKFKRKDKVLVVEDENPRQQLEIIEWDLLKGRFTLKEGKKEEQKIKTEGEFTIAPAKSFIKKEKLLAVLYNKAEALLELGDDDVPTGAVYDLLLKKAPKIKGYKTGQPLIDPEKNRIKELIRVVSQMNQNCLCIQGPPGAGKTYTGKKIIQALLKQGKTVAISSNSHKAIANLIKGVDEECKADRSYCRPLKISSTDEKELKLRHIPDTQVPLVPSDKSLNCIFGDSRKKVHEEGPVNVIGGTAFYLCKPEMQERFDYLFVDEATQVCLANIVSMSGCADNIVLLGDQNQLDQPIQATHPGESGNSSLVHYTNGAAVISPDKGVFLPETHRMHPEVTKVVSTLFYDGKLQSAEGNEVQKMEWDTKSKLNFPQTGIAFDPVIHLGNTHGSTEEVDRIKLIYKEALKSSWTNKDGESNRLTKDDIVIVSPYNYQVSLLREVLGENARIGSVDLFQGQEAPLVILSLCSSSTTDAPRGVSFLLNKNRVNVAFSRAKCLVIVVGSPTLADGKASDVRGMELINTICKIVNQ